MLENSSKTYPLIPYNKGYYVYVLRCEDESYYIGWTVDLRHRFHMHAIGKGARYTKSHRPLELYYFETFKDKQSAMRREYEIKQLKRQDKINLIKTYTNK